jgi:urease accessory protein
MKSPKWMVAPAMAALLAASAPAEAHIVAARLGDFYAGALHPLTDLQDIVLWIALGVFAGSLGPQRGRWLVLVMPLGLLAGFALERGFGVGALGALGNAALMVCIGLSLAAGIRLNSLTLCTLAFLLALTRGAANADGIGAETNPLLFSAGLATAGYTAITLIMALTVALVHPSVQRPRDWRQIAVRVCGSWIAAIGLMIGGFALRSVAS